MSGRLEGRIALVTGAGSIGPGWGNGRAMAVLFAREGAQVFLVDRDEAALGVTAEQVRNENGKAFTRIADVTDPGDVEGFMQECA